MERDVVIVHSGGDRIAADTGNRLAHY